MLRENEKLTAIEGWFAEKAGQLGVQNIEPY